MDPSIPLSKTIGVPLPDASSYRELIGCPFYLTITRPNIMYVVHRLSQFLSAPTYIHFQSAQCILLYLKSNPWQGLFYSADSDACLNVYVDAD